MGISKTPDYEKWFSKESLKSQAQIVARLTRVQIYNHFGDYKLLGENLLELR